MATKKYEKKPSLDIVEALNKQALDMYEQNLKYDTPYFENFELPVNLLTGNHYSGANIVLLGSLGFPDPRFATFLQIQQYAKEHEMQMHVRKGEHGAPVLKYVEIPISKLKGFKAKEHDTHGEVSESLDGIEEVVDSGSKKEPVVLLPKVAGYVFNGTQIEGLERYQARSERDMENNEDLDMFMLAQQEKFGIRHIRTERSAAFFSPSSNTIHTPIPELFKSDAHRYSTEIHEYGHALGAALGQDMSAKFGSKEYGKEELRAEHTSFVICKMLNLKYDASAHDSHGAYVKNWIEAIRGDRTFLIKAISDATKRVEVGMNTFEEYRQKLALSRDLAPLETRQQHERCVFPAAPQRRLALQPGQMTLSL